MIAIFLNPPKFIFFLQNNIVRIVCKLIDKYFVLVLTKINVQFKMFP